MIILQGTQLEQTFGAEEIFSDINLGLHAKERVGLVGPNGCGKTTLLQIIAGLQEPSDGTVSRNEELTLGYLQQEAVLTFSGQDNTIYEEMLSVFANLTQMENELRAMEAKMEAGNASEDLFAEYGRIQDLYEHGGGYDYQHDIKRVLHGLAFEPEQWDLSLTQLSGGQKTRVLLGRLLLEQPDLLILDEPTNHLDTTAVEWLEKTLRTWKGTLIIVSHDRYFLNRVVSHIWDLSPTQLKTYKGNYTSFVQQRDLGWEREEALFKSEIARLESELEFIRKNIAGGKTDIAKGKLKRLTREIVLIEEVGVVEMQNKSWLELGSRVKTISANEAAKRIQELPSPVAHQPKLKIKLEAEQRSGQVVLTSRRLQIGYPTKFLFDTDDIRLERLDCAALIGPNGSGKSTLLRTLMQEIPQIKGKLRFGDELIPGYFAQGHEQLHMEKTVLEEVLEHKAMSEENGRNYLAQYLFRGDDVFKQISDLSGGERGRLALSLLALDGANFLLLDEPTNHLDIPSQEVLQSVLEQYDGTIILVSHDRYLVDRLATQIWEIRDEHLHIFDGTYQEFLAEREGGQTGITTVSSKVELPTKVKEAEPIDLSWIEDIQPEPTNRSKRNWREQQRQIRLLTDQVDETEAWLAQLNYDLEQAKIAEDKTRIIELRNEKTVAEAELNKLSQEIDDLLD